MPASERRGDRGAQRVREQLVALGRDIRLARVAAGLSQRLVAKAAGLTQARVSQFERGRGPAPRVEALARLCASVGLELSVRAFAGGAVLRDTAHVALLDRLRAAASAIFRWRSEVPLPIAGDMRAWDRAAYDASGGRAFVVEAETRLRDVQALARRLALKKRDAGSPRMILLLADTRPNRAAIRAAGSYLADLFPIGSRDALAMLASGRVPAEDALILL